MDKTSSQILRERIRKHLFECMMDELSMLDEERISNDSAKEFVQNKENFIGSHIFGDNVNGNYIVCSYGEQFPIFIYDKDTDVWYENGDTYYFQGDEIEQTSEHKNLLRPTIDTRTQSLNWMLNKLDSIKKEAGIAELSHTSVEPGTKN
jgi:hypothetical protein